MGIQLKDSIGGTVRIVRRGANEWCVTQRSLGPEHDNAQNATWIEIDNPGRPATVDVRVKWADFRHMIARRFAYVKEGRSYRIVTAQVTPTTALYEFTAPTGRSLFGPCPWYTNDDADRFINGMCHRSSLCNRRSIGQTAEGRDIPCLAIGTADRLAIDSTRTWSGTGNGSGRNGEAVPLRERACRDNSETIGKTWRKRNIVLLGRVHATETAGSFAVEACARFLLGKAPREWLDRYTFHLFPNVNPDGIAHGIKLTRIGPADLCDMERGGMTSSDPTIRALRQEVLSLQPACLIDIHSYLFRIPMIYGFDRRFLSRILDALLATEIDPLNHSTYWHIYHQMRHRKGVLRDYCHKRFGTAVLAAELPWPNDRLPADIGRLGVMILKATMEEMTRKPPAVVPTAEVGRAPSWLGPAQRRR